MNYTIYGQVSFSFKLYFTELQKYYMWDLKSITVWYAKEYMFYTKSGKPITINFRPSPILTNKEGV